MLWRKCVRWCSTGNGFAFPTPRRLNEMVNMDLLKTKSSGEIAAIWDTYYRESKDAIGVSVKGKVYDTVQERMQKSRYFVFPVVRSEGMFTMISQIQDRTVLFTYLEAYKLNPSNAPPYVTLQVYEDLKEEKDIALLRGDIVNELNREEAEGLVNTFVQYYTMDELYQTYVHTFNHEPASFNFDAYMKLYQT